MAQAIRYKCYVPGCTVTKPHPPNKTFSQAVGELVRHFTAGAHPDTVWEISTAKEYNLRLLNGPSNDEMDNSTADSAAGRPQREKKPTEKVKVATKPKAEDKEFIVPPRYIATNPDDPKWSVKPKEIAKVYDHTKTSKLTGEATDFYKLGNHVESKNGQHYTRAQRDPGTGNFHAAEAAPHYARLSDEDHPLCGADRADITFTKDMLATSQSGGHTTTRANVFAREGTYYFETKLLSMSHEQAESRIEALATTEIKKGLTNEDTCRGSVRIGFVRREHHHGKPVGATGYSYGVNAFGMNVEEYGNGSFQSEVFKLYPKNPGKLKEGDVVGLMITLPSLSLHKKVVEGTFDQARDAPDLKCGPYVPKKTKSANKAGAKKGSKAKKDTNTEASKSESIVTSSTEDQSNTLEPPVELDILRDRAPFEYKKILYLESPEYAINRDIETGASGKGKSINPETGRVFYLREDTHPNHALPHLRTLPGSKIEMWVNGEYQGFVMEHLLAFLPPASYVDKGPKVAISGAIDDGLLGYYPAVSTYGGGAAQVKFDEPFDFPPKDRPEVQPFGKRYKEQIVDDFLSDIIDEACWESKGLGSREAVKNVYDAAALAAFAAEKGES